MMRRREFITAARRRGAAWPLAARAQQPAMPVIGFLCAGLPAPTHLMPPSARPERNRLRRGPERSDRLSLGGRRNDRLPAFAAELVGRKVAIIYAAGGTIAVAAAKAATTTIPIVFLVGDDPVQAGLIASLNRPGGNVTGIAFVNAQLTAKRIDFCTSSCRQPSALPYSSILTIKVLLLRW